MRQEWRKICDDKYEISREGVIRRTAPGRGAQVGRVLSPYPGKGGHEYVKLYADGEQHQVRVDVLTKVAFARDSA